MTQKLTHAFAYFLYLEKGTNLSSLNVDLDLYAEMRGESMTPALGALFQRISYRSVFPFLSVKNVQAKETHE